MYYQMFLSQANAWCLRLFLRSLRLQLLLIKSNCRTASSETILKDPECGPEKGKGIRRGCASWKTQIWEGARRGRRGCCTNSFSPWLWLSRVGSSNPANLACKQKLIYYCLLLWETTMPTMARAVDALAMKALSPLSSGFLRPTTSCCNLLCF